MELTAMMMKYSSLIHMNAVFSELPAVFLEKVFWNQFISSKTFQRCFTNNDEADNNTDFKNEIKNFHKNFVIRKEIILNFLKYISLNCNYKLFNQIKRYFTHEIYLHDTEEFKLIGEIVVPIVLGIRDIQIAKSIMDLKILNPLNRKKLFTAIICTIKMLLRDNDLVAEAIYSQIEDEHMKLQIEICDAFYNIKDMTITDITAYTRSLIKSTLMSAVEGEFQESIFNILEGAYCLVDFVGSHEFSLFEGI